MMKVLNDVKLSEFDIPAEAEVEFCENEGVKSIFLPSDKTISNGTFSCRQNAKFSGVPRKLCSCQTSKVEYINLKDGAWQSTISIPVSSKLYFTEGKISHFIPSEKSAMLQQVAFNADETYKVLPDKIVKLAVTDPSIPDCDPARKLDEKVLEKVLKTYHFKKDDMKMPWHTTDCEGYIGGKEIIGISGIFSKSIKNDIFSVPANTSFSFCDDQIGTLNSVRYGEITIFGRNCKGYVSSSWKGEIFAEENHLFSCSLAATITEKGVQIPSGVNIVFDKKNILCISKGEDSEELSLAGTKIELGYYQIKNGKVIRTNSCD